MDAFQVFVAQLVPFLLLLAQPELQFTASDKPNSFSLKLIHRDSPESPLYPGNLTFHEQVQRYIKRSESRASYLMSITAHNNTMHPDMMHPPVGTDGFLYMVLVEVGTPRKKFWLLLDTGGGLSWLRCLPCKSCFPQNITYYNPLDSNSYRKVPCNNPLCYKPFVCTNGECRYNIGYGDKSTSKGIASWEAFSFMSPDKTHTTFHDILFGCTDPYQSSSRFIRDVNIAGIMGLNLNPTSLISQMGSFIERRFSYCLVDPSAGDNPISYLKFGIDMGYRGGAVQTTPFVKLPNPYFYGLNLLDISINHKRLNYPPDTFKVKDNGKGGCFIDSGAGISYFDNNAYWKLHNEFASYFSQFQLKKHDNCIVPMKLCYSYPADFNSFPSMTYHFQGANLRIAPEQVFFINRKHKFFTLAIAPFTGITILGAW